MNKRIHLEFKICFYFVYKWKDQPQFMTIYSDEVVLDFDEGIC